jgi:hypothetical protein
MSRKDDPVIIGMEVRSADGEVFPVDLEDVTSPYDFVDTVLRTSEPGETVVLFEIRNGVRKSLMQSSR